MQIKSLEHGHSQNYLGTISILQGVSQYILLINYISVYLYIFPYIIYLYIIYINMYYFHAYIGNSYRKNCKIFADVAIIKEMDTP